MRSSELPGRSYSRNTAPASSTVRSGESVTECRSDTVDADESGSGHAATSTTGSWSSIGASSASASSSSTWIASSAPVTSSSSPSDDRRMSLSSPSQSDFAERDR